MGTLGREVGSDLIGYVAERLALRLAGLTDDEYLWQPVADCWTIRPNGAGDWHADVGPSGSTATTATPAPFTTIAWRLWHLGASTNPTWPPRRPRNASELIHGWFGQPRADRALAIPDAATARSLVHQQWNDFAVSVSALGDEELLTVMGPVAGPFASSTVLGLVLHIADELVHHAAEVGVVRDLYAHR